MPLERRKSLDTCSLVVFPTLRAGGTHLALFRNTLARSEFCAAKFVKYSDRPVDDKNSATATRAHAFSAVDNQDIYMSGFDPKPTIKIFLEVGINIKHAIWVL